MAPQEVLVSDFLPDHEKLFSAFMKTPAWAWGGTASVMFARVTYFAIFGLYLHEPFIQVSLFLVVNVIALLTTYSCTIP